MCGTGIKLCIGLYIMCTLFKHTMRLTIELNVGEGKHCQPNARVNKKKKRTNERDSFYEPREIRNEIRQSTIESRPSQGRALDVRKYKQTAFEKTTRSRSATFGCFFRTRGRGGGEAAADVAADGASERSSHFPPDFPLFFAPVPPPPGPETVTTTFLCFPSLSYPIGCHGDARFIYSLTQNFREFSKDFPSRDGVGFGVAPATTPA